MKNELEPACPSMNMDLRDYFAAKAMQALLSRADCRVVQSNAIRWAEESYLMADVMLAVRKNYKSVPVE